MLVSVLWAYETGITVDNIAGANYTTGGTSSSALSNEVRLTLHETNATIDFLQFQDDGNERYVLGHSAYRDENDIWHPLPSASDEDGNIKPPNVSYPMGIPPYFHIASSIIIKVEDADQNVDNGIRDTLQVEVRSPTGDAEFIRLIETGVDTGIFVGYLPLGADAGIGRDGILYVRAGDEITANYDDNVAVRVTKAFVIDKNNLRIWIEKKVNKDQASIGETLYYTLVVHNDEPVTFSDMRVEDRLPLGIKYIRDTARIDGKKSPVRINRDGRTLIFPLPRLKGKSEVTVGFLTQIGAGIRRRYVVNEAYVTNKSGDVRASAIARNDVAATTGTQDYFLSNVATARTDIIEELMRSEGIVVGTVYACDYFRKGIGIAGVRIYMENGAYVVTDEYGRYHFEGVEKGLHVVQIDEAFLPEGYRVPKRRRGRSVRHAGREISQFVHMHTGVLKRVDFCLDGPVPQKPKRREKKKEDDAHTIYLDGKGNGEVEPSVDMTNAVPEKEVREERNADIEYVGPEASEAELAPVYYEPEENNVSQEEEVADEVLHATATSPDENVTDAPMLTYEPVMPSEEQNATLHADATARQAGLRTETQTNAASDEAISEEDDEEILEDEDDESMEGDEFIPSLAEDGRLVQEKAEEPPTRYVSQPSSAPPSLPGERIRQFEMPDEVSMSPRKRRTIHTFEMPAYGADTLFEAKHDAEILWPPQGHVPDLPSTEIAVLHTKDLKAVVKLNGFEVSKRNYGGRIATPESDKVIDIYKGVDLLRRTNRIEVDFFDASGRLVRTLRRDVHVTGRPVYVEYVPEKSTPIADGRTNPVIAVRFYDADGYPLRKGITGTFGIDDPYRSQTSIDEILNNPLGGSFVGENRYTIDEEGIAYIKLQPTTQSGTVTLHFNILNRDEIVRAWLEPVGRDWIVVGYAQGRVGFDTASGSNDSLHDVGLEEGTNFEGRVAFFAKGSVEKWLLTVAYDSGKDTENTTFFDEIDPNAYYTLYNDNSVVNYDAPSRKKLYVKAEKDRFSVLFGDYHTDLFETELARYSRTFTGIETEYHGDRIEGKVFAAETDQLFVKDEIQGDGTSGYYYLSNRNIIEFSEKIEIQVRDRYHPERVIDTLTLQRYKDYEIDYDRGRIYFKAPVYSRDENFNPQYIVVDYEVSGDGRKRYTYGGRVTAKFMQNKVRVGTTYVSEDNVKQNSTLTGADVTVRLDRTTTIKAEYARTSTTQEGNTTDASAMFFEVEHLADDLYLRAYFRQQDQGFGLGQISGGLGGTRMYGVEFSKTYDNRVNLILAAYRNSDLATGEDQDVVEGRFAFEETFWGAYLGYRFADATATDAAHQLLVGGYYYLLDKRLKLHASHDQTFGADEDELFPTKTTVGVDYAVTENTTLFAAYEWQHGDRLDTEYGRIGMRLMPWQGMTFENTTLTENTTDGTRLYNTTGMRQTYQYNENWSFSLGYEHGEMLDGNLTGEETDFDAYHVGVTYRTERWVAMANTEYRQADTENKYNVNLGVYRQLNDTTALALSLDYNRYEAHDGNLTGVTEDADMRFSLAYRPLDGNIVVLDRLDWIRQKDSVNAATADTQKIVNNLSFNYRFDDADAEVTLQHGFKYVQDTVLDYEFDGVTQLLGVDAWYGIDEKWLVGAHGSILYAFEADNFDYATGIYAGYNIYTNMFILAGYNWEGFEDRDFSLQNYQMKGPYIEFRMKFDQRNLRQLLGFASPASDSGEDD